MTKISAVGALATPVGTSYLEGETSGGTSEHYLISTLPYPPGFLYGLALSNGTDATNDINIATGNTIDSTSAVNMVLASALTKQLDAAWAVGTNQGGLDTGSIDNVTYHIWLIKRSDTGVVDALFSASASSPTMPASYDYKRRIGSIVRTSGAIKAFIQDNDTFTWSVPVSDVTATNPGTSAVTRTLTVPTGIRVEAILSVRGEAGAVAADNPQGILITDLSVTDTVPSSTLFTLYMYNGGAASNQGSGTCRVITNTSAQVRSRIQVSTAATQLQITTLGWVDTRGRLG